MTERCAELSAAAGEPLVATAARTDRWLVLEVPGAWPRDVSTGASLPEDARRGVQAWLESASGSGRVLFVRRPGLQAGGPLRAFVVSAEERSGEVRRIGLSSHAELAALDLESAGEPVDTRLVLVCAHGTRDPCCALAGSAVFGALRDVLGEEDVWISSHHGGHRFAANVLVLPYGLQFGRVSRDEAPSLVADARAGTIELTRYRGRTLYVPEVQAAEHAVRTASGLVGVHDLFLEHAAADGSVVRFRDRHGAEHRALVERIAGPFVPASCNAPPEAQPAFGVRLEPSGVRPSADTRDP